MKADVIIIGAGASGLMAARELSPTGLKIEILEAQNRIGGRINTFTKELFGFHAEGGAEFVHGDPPLTLSLIKEAKLNLIKSEGEIWNARSGELQKNENFIPDWDLVMQKLKDVKEDIPIGQFLEKEFNEAEHTNIHNSIKAFVEGFDAADPKNASTIALRAEWEGEDEMKQYRIREGYSALIEFLKGQCLTNNITIRLGKEVTSVDYSKGSVRVKCLDGTIVEGAKVILTAPLPILKNISFNPPFPEKIKAASDTGFGIVIKFLLGFKESWWTQLRDHNLTKASFFFSNAIVPTWWTQYPETYPILTGWLSGPKTELYLNYSEEELLKIGLTSLSNIFKLEYDQLHNALTNWRIINWATNPYAKGAYSYPTTETSKAKEELLRPVSNTIYFAGEALNTGKEIGTVEAALASGLNTATIIKSSYQ